MIARPWGDGARRRAMMSIAVIFVEIAMVVVPSLIVIAIAVLTR